MITSLPSECDRALVWLPCDPAHVRQDLALTLTIATTSRTHAASPLIPFADHAVLCPNRCGHYRVLNDIVHCLVQSGRDISVEVWTEQVCPQLLVGEAGSESAVEARLDAHLLIPTCSCAVCEEWIDITVVHP